MVRLTRSGLVCSGGPEDLGRLRAQFAARHFVRLLQFIDRPLLLTLQARIAQAEFAPLAHEGVGHETCMAQNIAFSALHFLANDPRLFRFVRNTTGCGRIGCFVGRVYRMLPAAGHSEAWHTDTLEHRMIGMSINLGTDAYEGGVFRLRCAQSQVMLGEVANTGPGDTILFRIAADLEHEVTPLEGTTPKTAFAGWFRSHPEFRLLLKHARGARSTSATRARSYAQYR